MGSYISAQVNSNTIYERSVTTPLTKAAGTVIFATICHWPTRSFIEGITVTPVTNAVPNLGLKIVGDGAAYNTASNDGAVYYTNTYAVTTPAGVPVFMAVEKDVTDLTSTGSLHLCLSSSAFATGTALQIVVQGRIHSTVPATVSALNVLGQKSNVRLLAQSATETRDVTRMLTGGTLTGDIANNNNPTAGGIGTTALVGTGGSDYFYIGATTKFSKILFGVASSTLQPRDATVVYEFWNGSTWTSTGLTPSDNTSDHQATPSGFSYPGCVTFSGAYTATWASQKLAIDPMTARETAIINASSSPNAEGPPVFWNYPPRYWIRFRCPQLVGELRLTKVSLIA